MPRFKHILNLRALAKLIKDPANTNAYYRINLIMKSGIFAATPELLDEMERIIKQQTESTLKHLQVIRKAIAEENAA